MRSLHLVLTKEWFEKIRLGKKTIEYRLCKPYWTKRLLGKEYELIVFRNGYKRNAPIITRKFDKIEVFENGMLTDLKTLDPVYAIHFSDYQEQRNEN